MRKYVFNSVPVSDIASNRLWLNLAALAQVEVTPARSGSDAEQTYYAP